MSQNSQMIEHVTFDPEINKGTIETKLNISKQSAEQIRGQIWAMLCRNSPNNRIEEMALFSEKLPDVFPEKEKIQSQLSAALEIRDFFERECVFERVKGLMTDATARAQYRSKINQLRNAGNASASARLEKSKDKKNWIKDRATTLIDDGANPRDISAIIHKEICREIEVRHGDTAINFPDDHPPSIESVREWTREIRKSYSKEIKQG